MVEKEWASFRIGGWMISCMWSILPMDSRIRGKGYGGIAIETLVNETGKVVVLEVELPD